MKRMGVIAFVIFLVLILHKINFPYFNTTVHIKTKLYEAQYGRKVAKEKKDEPNIVLLVNIDDKKNTLEKFLNISGLRVVKEEPEVKLCISYDKKKKRQPKFMDTIQLNETEYTIFLIPQRENPKKFTMEICRRVSQYSSSKTFKLIELVFKKEIVFDVNRVKILGFFFDENVYFLALHFSMSTAAAIY
ncbi:MAG: hypothetical protein ACETWK_01930 [Candidatus Aminicenantaceae bacterium]